MTAQARSHPMLFRRAMFIAAATLYVSLAQAWPVAPTVRGGSNAQRVLDFSGAQRIREASPTAVGFDVAPNSIGLIFTTLNEDHLTHIWLPLGQRVSTRDDPRLPLHPQSARITTLIRSSPPLAMPEHLDQVQCTIFPYINKTTASERRWDLKFGRDISMRQRDQDRAEEGVRFMRKDELVRLAEAGSVFWLGRSEVEAYECA